MIDRDSEREPVEIWLEALQGRQLPSMSPEARKEAEMLRDLIHERALRLKTPASDDDIRKFISRLKRENLLDPKQHHWPKLLAIASIGVIALSIAIVQPWRTEIEGMTDEAAIWRGNHPIQEIRVSNPVEAAAKVEAILRESRLMVRRIDEAESIRLQAKIPADADGLKHSLTAEGIQLPVNGDLDVRWIKR